MGFFSLGGGLKRRLGGLERSPSPCLATLAQLYVKQWWWPVAAPGFGVTTIEAPKARAPRHRAVWGWVFSPQPTRGGWGSVVSSPSGVRPLSHFLHILYFLYELQIPLWKSGGESPLSKVTIVTYKVAPMPGYFPATATGHRIGNCRVANYRRRHSLVASAVSVQTRMSFVQLMPANIICKMLCYWLCFP